MADVSESDMPSATRERITVTTRTSSTTREWDRLFASKVFLRSLGLSWLLWIKLFFRPPHLDCFVFLSPGDSPFWKGEDSFRVGASPEGCSWLLDCRALALALLAFAFLDSASTRFLAPIGESRIVLVVAVIVAARSRFWSAVVLLLVEDSWRSEMMISSSFASTLCTCFLPPLLSWLDMVNFFPFDAELVVLSVACCFCRSAIAVWNGNVVLRCLTKSLRWSRVVGASFVDSGRLSCLLYLLPLLWAFGLACLANIVIRACPCRRRILLGTLNYLLVKMQLLTVT